MGMAAAHAAATSPRVVLLSDAKKAGRSLLIRSDMGDKALVATIRSRVDALEHALPQTRPDAERNSPKHSSPHTVPTSGNAWTRSAVAKPAKLPPKNLNHPSAHLQR